jgi:short-subunit dehydrogenase
VNTGGIIGMPKLDKLGEWKNPGKVFITGASSGIGASYAKALAENGFDLVLLARRKDRLQALANQLESVIRESAQKRFKERDLRTNL